MPSIKLTCERCNNEHSWEVKESDISKGVDFNLACLNIKRLSRVTTFRIDTTKTMKEFDKSYERTLITNSYGLNDMEGKIERWNEVNKPRLWFIYDFDPFMEHIFHAYISGDFYPVATACTTLAERLANLFIIKMRDLYPRTSLDNECQKYVYEREASWQNQAKNIAVLKQWGLVNSEQEKCFNELLKIRRRSVHYQEPFDVKKDASTAIINLRELIDSYFSQFDRKDILRVFEIPGEIWVRENKMKEPFVQAFILPNCTSFASKGYSNKDRVYHEKYGIAGEFSEEEFIEQRKKSSSEEEFQSALDYEPIYKKYTLENGKQINYRII